MNTQYTNLQHDLGCGWNTWNTRSVLSHVLLPAGFALHLGIKEYRSGCFLGEALIGRRDAEAEKIHPGLRSYDGAYTELRITWKDITLHVESGLDGDDFLLLVTPLANQVKPATLIVQGGFLWNRPGHVVVAGTHLTAHWPDRVCEFFATCAPIAEHQFPTLSPYLALPLSGPVGLAGGRSVVDHDDLKMRVRDFLY